MAKTRSTARKTTKKSTASKVTKKTAKKSSKKVTKKKVAKKTAKTTKVAKTSAKKVTRKAAGSNHKAKPVAKAPPKPKKVKTKLDRKALNYYRDMLLERRHEIIGDINGMEDAALRSKDASNLSNMPLHMADVGSDNYEQDLTLGLMETERQMLNEIDEALNRIQDGTFGICQATQKPINKARLEAKPWAKYCIEAARDMERGVRF